MNVDRSEISLEMTFDTGHRIVGHKGKCARLHGHTYRAIITCQGLMEDPGFVVDFGDIKDFVNEWDHRTLLWEEDPILQDMLGFMDIQGLDQHGIIRLPFNPTAENMAFYLANGILYRFQNLHQVLITLYETPKSCARAKRTRDE